MTKPIPLPASLRDLVAESQSLSLRFDRGYDGYDAAWKHRKAIGGQKEGKTEFLENFAKAFNTNVDAKKLSDQKKLYDQTIARRTKALEPLVPSRYTSTSPLIVGIGRWNPVEVGFTFDRLTGSPFLPGSSVKGVLLAAANLVAIGELDGDREFWDEKTIKRVFGVQDSRGAFAFYDAYPEHWPTLEVDVMTPHHSKTIAADWDEPVPVHFLRIKRGTTFLFWIGAIDDAAAEADRAALATLLTTALDWLGIGAKTSSGYGWFEAAAGATTRRHEEIVIWERAVLEWHPQTATIKITAGLQHTETKDKQILGSVSEAVMARLKKRKNVTATVRVKRDGNQFIVLKIEPD
jgi:CRISPR-associated protein Cmr6